MSGSLISFTGRFLCKLQHLNDRFVIEDWPWIVIYQFKTRLDIFVVHSEWTPVSIKPDESDTAWEVPVTICSWCWLLLLKYTPVSRRFADYQSSGIRSSVTLESRSSFFPLQIKILPEQAVVLDNLENIRQEWFQKSFQAFEKWLWREDLRGTSLCPALRAMLRMTRIVPDDLANLQPPAPHADLQTTDIFLFYLFFPPIFSV
jgi:hypothetical protein